MSRTLRLLACTSLLVTAAGAASPVAVTAALTYPSANVKFPECSSADQEFCVEGLWFTPVGGSETAITAPATQGSQAWVQAGFYQGAYTGPNTTPASTGLMPILNAIVYNPTGFPGASVQDGLVAGTYRFRIRLGDFDPTYTVIQGDAKTHVVERGTDGYFTLELSGDAKPWMHVQGATAIAACIAGKWKTNCEATNAYRNWFGTAIVMHGVAARRELSRGQWFSTSASYIVPSAPVRNGPEVKQTLTVAGPHFVPAGIGDTGYSENGRYLNPARYKTFIPYNAVVNSLKLAGVTTTEEQIQLVLASRPIFSGTIVDEAGVTRNQDLTITAVTGGVIIDYNLQTFSSPNPALFISNPSRVRRTFKAGATISPLIEVGKKRRVSPTALLAPGPGTKVTSVTSRSKRQCVVKGSTIMTQAPGTCRLSVGLSIKVGKKTTTSRATVTVTVK
jgi:hypothetical protein